MWVGATRETAPMAAISETLVILLRGINVGGHNRLAMAQLRDIASAAGFGDARTYIQSGNLVASTDLDPDAAAEKLTSAIRASTGLEVPTIVRTAQQWIDLFAANPFPDVADPGTRVHVVFLPTSASDEIETFDASRFAPETMAVVGSELYLHLPDGMGRSKLVLAVNRLPEVAAGTARNWRTVQKLAELAAS